MRTSVYLASLLCATSAFAKPVQKREVIVEEVVEEIIVTVTTTVTWDGFGFETAAQAYSSIESSSDTAVTTSSSAATTVASSPTSAVAVEIASTSSVASESSETESSSVAESTSATSTSVSSTTSAATSTSSASSDYQSILVDKHNAHRSNNSASALTWNDTLATIAQEIAESCDFAHNMTVDGGGYGQNIGAGYEPADIASMINDMYNNEIENYPLPYGDNNPDMGDFEGWGHYSQIVWKDTSTFGCATVQCSTLTGVDSDVPPYFSVCNYYPEGNIEGEYSNVGAPLGDAVLDS